MWWRKPYVSVAQRQAKAHRLVKSLMKQNKNLLPARVTGRQIAESFWGKSWCQHFERQADYSNRLSRGRSYVMNDAVCHLELSAGRIYSLVSGSELYEVEMNVAPLSPAKWEKIKKLCQGQISTLVELLCGQFSAEVMAVVSHPVNGMFPLTGEISYKCSCPDWAGLCKHVAAVFYALGNRLDNSPELLFQLRGVDPAELLDAGVDHLSALDGVVNQAGLSGDLEDIFGVELDTFNAAPPADAPQKATPSKRAPAASPPSTPRDSSFTLVPAPSSSSSPAKGAAKARLSEVESLSTEKLAPLKASPVEKPQKSEKTRKTVTKAQNKAPIARPLAPQPDSKPDPAPKKPVLKKTFKFSDISDKLAPSSSVNANKEVEKSVPSRQPEKTARVVPVPSLSGLKDQPEELHQSPSNPGSVPEKPRLKDKKSPLTPPEMEKTNPPETEKKSSRAKAADRVMELAWRIIESQDSQRRGTKSPDKSGPE
ncbi:MAG: SWIM zinc finger family protein [Deltaproteobacteria bacterium]|jgi:uncharacterized Zn finger protein|nr:SWIM zinc finger family protein [Deltaproteobacteria bacterium]